MTDTIAATEGGENGTASGSEVRLGRVERAILAALPRDGGFVSRDTVVRAAYPDAKPPAAVASADRAVVQPVPEGRALAEAAVSRAIASLQRKGLVVRDRNRVTGRTLLRSSAALHDPSWELVARAEEDFSAHAAAMARQWRSLSARARERAGRVRVDRSPTGTEDERRLDMALAPQCEAHAAAERRRACSRGAPRVSDWLPPSTRSAGDGSATSTTAPGRTSLRSRSSWLSWRFLRRKPRAGAISEARGRA